MVGFLLLEDRLLRATVRAFVKDTGPDPGVDEPKPHAGMTSTTPLSASSSSPELLSDKLIDEAAQQQSNRYRTSDRSLPSLSWTECQSREGPPSLL